MDYCMKRLSLSDVEAIYNKYIHLHFPKEEIKPLKNIQRMWEDCAYQGLGMYENSEGKGADNLIGYAFFAMAENTPVLLLDYYAIVEEYRSKGAGSVFLQSMQSYLSEYKGILLETEDIEHAANEEERRIRERRDEFYTRNGVMSTPIKSIVYGVRYAIWYLSFDGKQDDEFCTECLRNIYRSMVPGEKYKEHIQIGISI